MSVTLPHPLCVTPPTAGSSQTSAVALIVEADQGVRALCRTVLQREGWKVVEVQTGREAIAYCQISPPDIVIMDVELPGDDGIEAIQQIRTAPESEGIPIVMLSVEDDAPILEAALEAGADSYLRKPVMESEFALRVRSLSRLRRAWRELQHDRSALGEQARALSLLLDFSAALSRKADLESILNKTIDVTTEMISCRRISIMLPDPTETYLSIAASLGVEDNIIRNVRLPMGESIAGRVFLSRRTVVLNDQEQVQRELDDRDLRMFSGLPMLSAPMCASERVVGVLNATGRLEERPFEARELGYLNLLTNYAASAIANVRAREARDQARDSIVVALAKLAEHRDDDTGKHLDRVTLFCLKLAERLRGDSDLFGVVDAEFLRNLERAAPLHDIGKVAVPDAILLKPGKLTEDEMEIMRRHAGVGAETIRSLLARSPDSGFLRMAEEIAYGHHEWFNGEGYPCGISGDAIPLAARIVAVADVYDALTTKRVYKEAMPHRKAVDIIIRESGKQFDPSIVQAFRKLESEFERLARELSDDGSEPAPLTCGTKFSPREMDTSAFLSRLGSV